MRFYFAPMEGITSYIFRNAYEKHYGGIAKYFTPFISPADNCAMNPKERRDVMPEHNGGRATVPQILANRAEHFIAGADILLEMGYRELNINLGCPSGTVVSKKKGAGFLTEYYALERFLDAVYDYAEAKGIRVSVKTRIGRYDADEWYDLLDIYNRYPISELIVHPRIRDDYYRENPRREYYEYALNHSRNPLVYNGNVFTVRDILKQGDLSAGDTESEAAGGDNALMLGRGLLYNPELPMLFFRRQKGELPDGWDGDTLFYPDFDLQRFRSFHDDLYEGYREIMSPDINVMHHLKGLWIYWREQFPDKKKTIKKIMKCKRYAEYEALLAELGL